jgi:hypothetical protein
MSLLFPLWLRLGAINEYKADESSGCMTWSAESEANMRLEIEKSTEPINKRRITADSSKQFRRSAAPDEDLWSVKETNAFNLSEAAQ